MMMRRAPRILNGAAQRSHTATRRGASRYCSIPLVWQLASILLAVFVGTVSGASPEPVTVEARRECDAVIVEAHALLHADLEIAWDVLTDYDRYAEFIPDLKSSRVVARSGRTVIVEQKGQVVFFLFRFPMEVTLSVTEDPRSGITSRAIAGTFREMTGSYTLTRDGNELRFSYSGRMVPDFLLPPLIGTAAVKGAVKKQFGALVKQMQTRGATPSKLPAAQ
jgi:ribosome-associated toxin RatA of RatAB toxin-antitoxin module